MLYINAQKRFCFIFLKVNLDKLIASNIFDISPFEIIISALSMVRSEPVPIATPISAAFSAAASFIHRLPSLLFYFLFDIF